MNKKEQKSYKNTQVFKETVKSKNGTILIETDLGMVKESSFDDKNTITSSKVILTIQESDNSNKMKNKISFYFSLSDWMGLCAMSETGYYSKKIAISKLEGYAEVAYETIKDSKHKEKFKEEYENKYKEIALYPLRLDIEDVNNFIMESNSKYKISPKIPFLSPIEKPFLGGSVQNKTARILELIPGNSQDLMLTLKEGKGKVNTKTGGISMEKVETTLRFPMTYQMFLEMMLTTKLAIASTLPQLDLYKQEG